MAIIYVITNQINKKQYVGVTKFSLEKRFKEHCRDSKKERCKNRLLYFDMNKYGVENFCIEELEQCEDNDRFNREVYWVNKLDTCNNGYNFTFGGTGKKFYDHEAIANKYIELGTVNGVCDCFNCDHKIVEIACNESDIKIISGAEHIKTTCSKSVDMIDKNTDKLLMSFISAADAGRYFGNKKKSCHIIDVCNHNRKTAYGYKWRWHEESNSELAS